MINEIAERLRILGVTAPGTFEEIQALASIKSGSAGPPADSMVGDLLAGHGEVIRRIKALITIADNSVDEGMFGLLSERLASHEKVAWMPRSTLI